MVEMRLFQDLFVELMLDRKSYTVFKYRISKKDV